MFRNDVVNFALGAAFAGPGIGKRGSYRLGAALCTKRGRVITAKHNEYKTHPFLARFTEFPCLHAETNCIISHGLDNCSGLDLYVVRVTKNGMMAISKPCEVCSSVIKMAGIRHVWYSTHDGFIGYDPLNPSVEMFESFDDLFFNPKGFRKAA